MEEPQDGPGKRAERISIQAMVPLSCLFLALCCWAAIGPALARSEERPAVFTFTALAEKHPTAKLAAIAVNSLIVDDRRVPVDAVDRDPGWQIVSTFLFFAGLGPPASFRVRGHHVAFLLSHGELGGRIQVQRDSDPPVAIDTFLAGVPLERRWHELPGRPAPPWVLPLSLAVLLALAVALAPWRGDRAATWLVLHLAAANFLVWASEPVGVTVDSRAYLETFPTDLVHGHSSYFPPGYPLFLEAVSRIVPADAVGGTVTWIQAALLTLSGLWLYRWLEPLAGRIPAMAATLLAGSAPSALYLARAVLSENANVLGVTGAAFFTLRACAHGRNRDAVLAGLLGGAAALARVTPLVTVIPFYALNLLSPVRGGVRRALVSTALTLAMLLVPMAWFWSRSGHFELAWSSGGHVFNRVVYGQHLLDRDGERTKELLARLGDPDPFAHGHVVTRWSLEKKGMGTREATALQAAVALEAIRAHPSAYVLGSLAQALKQAVTPPEAAWSGMALGPQEGLEDPPWLGCSRTGLSWGQAMMEAEQFLWPPVAAVGLLAALVILVTPRRREPALLAMAWIVPTTLLPQAFLDIPEGRRTIVLVWVLVPLAVVAVSRAVRRGLGLAKRA